MREMQETWVEQLQQRRRRADEVCKQQRQSAGEHDLPSTLRRKQGSSSRWDWHNRDARFLTPAPAAFVSSNHRHVGDPRYQGNALWPPHHAVVQSAKGLCSAASFRRRISGCLSSCATRRLHPLTHACQSDPPSASRFGYRCPCDHYAGLPLP